MSTNNGWIFGPMAVETAAVRARAEDATVATSNGRPPAAAAVGAAYDARVVRLGGDGSFSGYAGFYDSDDYPDALENIWGQGSGEVALVFSKIGDHLRWVTVHTWLDDLQELDGSLQYVEVEDETYGLFTFHSVAGAAWYIIAHLEGGIWSDPVGPICMRNIV